MFDCVSICLLSGHAVSVVFICSLCHNAAANPGNAATCDNAYLGTCNKQGAVPSVQSMWLAYSGLLYESKNPYKHLVPTLPHTS